MDEIIDGGGFGFDEIRIAQVEVNLSSSKSLRSSEYVKGEFLKGPIPLSWLSPACKLSGKALATALAIWFLAGVKRKREDLVLTTAVLNRFHVNRFAKGRALEKLEEAGLITVIRRPQRNPLVTILQS